MQLNSVTLVYFSPTRTTKRVLEEIAAGLDCDTVTHVDLTSPAVNGQALSIDRASLALIGAPVYGGRLPAVAVQRLRQVQGNGALAVPVVLYGNRLFEDALLELCDLAAKQSFRPIAGGAFIGEHSYSTKSLPLSPGRPDEQDLEQACDFGRQIREKLLALPPTGILPMLAIPGDYPYREWRKRTDITPVTQTDICTRCGACVEVCPTSAIAPDDVSQTDPAACLLCCACVRACPVGARTLDDPDIQQTREWLASSCAERKEPEVWL
ncbi:MAG: 4Fe-4S binding protein [Anaerolineae bacterium]|nr:4Fe-4S binding protein [Anaerolineae bacterium]